MMYTRPTPISPSEVAARDKSEIPADVVELIKQWNQSLLAHGDDIKAGRSVKLRVALLPNEGLHLAMRLFREAGWTVTAASQPYMGGMDVVFQPSPYHKLG